MIRQKRTVDEHGDVRPIPDPTVLTTRQVIRETDALREIIETRLDGNDKAIELLQRQADRLPSLGMVDGEVKFVKEQVVKLPDIIKEAVDHLQELYTGNIKGLTTQLDERFAGIIMQFEERDKRHEKARDDNKIAVDYALEAAKEAVTEQNRSNGLAITKSENGFTKQIDQIAVVIDTLSKSIDQKINDLKSQVAANISRTEVNSSVSALVERTAVIERTIANYEGRMMMVGLLAAAIPTVVTVLLHFLK